MFYFGVVEDRQDPYKIGRCRVRVVGVHSEDTSKLPTSDLPWAIPMTPITSASVSGIGDAPVGPVEGTWCVIIFRDGKNCQQPVILGTLAGYPTETSKKQAFSDLSGKYPLKSYINQPDTNKLARHDEKIEETVVPQKEKGVVKNVPIAGCEDGSWSQPAIPYSAMYPFNHVFESESGNIREIDDTPNAERTHEYHRSGTYTEIDRFGTRVNRIVGSNFEIIEKDGYIKIAGQCVVKVDGAVSILASNAFVNATGNVNVMATRNVNIGTSTGKITLDAGATGDIQMICKNYIVNAIKVSFNTATDFDVLAGKNINLHAMKKTYIQSFTAKPTAYDPATWSKFKFSSLAKLPDPPSRHMDTLLTVEGATSEELKKVGINPNDPDFARPKDKDGKDIMPQKETPLPESPAEKKVDAVEEPNCEFANDYQVSPNFKLGQILSPLSGGKIISQHGLTGCQVMTNLKRVMVNIVEPIYAKYGSNLVLTSTFRKAGNPKSIPGKISKHELGLAVDMQFRDCPDHNAYAQRAKEIKAICSFDYMLVENEGGKNWLHFQFNG